MNSNYNLPYVGRRHYEESLIETCQNDILIHSHIIGKAGTGKSRLIHEALKKVQQNVMVYKYVSLPDSVFKQNILFDLMNQLSIVPIDFENENRSFIENYICQKIVKKLETRKIIFIFEDLHWKDDDRDSFLQKLLFKLPPDQKNISIITSSRANDSLNISPEAITLKLDKLSQYYIENLIENVIELSNETKEKLINSNNGHPLYLVESIKLSKQIGTEFNILMPDTLDSVYNLQHSFCDIYEQQVLEAASVVGPKFDLNKLKILLPHIRDSVSFTINKLVKKGYIIEAAEKKYEFSHALQQKAIYSLVHNQQKVAWHLELAHFYKRQKKRELVGFHFFKADSFKNALPYLTYSARQNLRMACPQQAEDFFNMAFDAFEKIKDFNPRSYFNLKIDYCNSLVMQGDVKRLEPAFHSLKNFDGILVNDHFKKQTLSIEIPYKWINADYTKDYVLNLLSKIPNEPSVATEKNRLFGMLVDIGEYKIAITKIEEFNRSLATNHKHIKIKTLSPAMHINLLTLLTFCYSKVGQKNNALLCMKKWENLINEAHLEKRQTIYSYTVMAQAMCCMNHNEKAFYYIKKAYDFNIDAKIGVITPDILSCYGKVLMKRDEHINALMLLDQCMEFVEKKGIISNLSHHLNIMAEIYKELGLLSKAMDVAQKSKKFARKHSHHQLLEETKILIDSISTQEKLFN